MIRIISLIPSLYSILLPRNSSSKTTSVSPCEPLPLKTSLYNSQANPTHTSSSRQTLSTILHTCSTLQKPKQTIPLSLNWSYTANCTCIYTVTEPSPLFYSIQFHFHIHRRKQRPTSKCPQSSIHNHFWEIICWVCLEFLAQPISISSL